MAWNFGSRCISIDGRSGGGTRMVLSTVPGELENKRMWSPRYTASSIEWVMKKIVGDCSRHSSTRLTCIRVRVGGSSAPNGSPVWRARGTRVRGPGAVVPGGLVAPGDRDHAAAALQLGAGGDEPQLVGLRHAGDRDGAVE